MALSYASLSVNECIKGKTAWTHWTPEWGPSTALPALLTHWGEAHILFHPRACLWDTVVRSARVIITFYSFLFEGEIVWVVLSDGVRNDFGCLDVMQYDRTIIGKKWRKIRACFCSRIWEIEKRTENLYVCACVHIFACVYLCMHAYDRYKCLCTPVHACAWVYVSPLKAPEILPSLSPQYYGYRHVLPCLSFTWELGFKLRSSCSYGDHFTHWSIFPGWVMHWLAALANSTF